MSVRMRHTSGHTANRRSHHKVAEPRLGVCADCSTLHVRHHACANCGKYRGRVVVDVKAQIEKKEAKMKARAKAIGTQVKGDSKVEESKESTDKKPNEGEVRESKDTQLDPASLSKK